MTPLTAVHGVERDLREAGVPSPRVDAEHLVAHVLGLSRTELYASDILLEVEQLERLGLLAARRREREPLAYILGEWGFRHLTLSVDRRVLVPRPETEMVVERCLERIAGVDSPRVVDVGTGSGAIALAIADECPGAQVVATDRSGEALEVARGNARRLGLADRVKLWHGHLLAGAEGPFDLVVSNPPYVLESELAGLQPEVRLYEPRVAVVGELSQQVARAALGVLRPGGWLVLECGDGQAGRVVSLLHDLGYADVRATADLAGRDRAVEGQWLGSGA